MDPRFFVIREERRRVIVKRHVPPQLEEAVRVLVMEPIAMSSDEYAQFFHTKMAAHLHVHSQRPPVSTQVPYQLPIAQNQNQQASHEAPHPAKKPATGTVINSDEAARIFGGVVIRDFGRNNKLPHVRAF